MVYWRASLVTIAMVIQVSIVYGLWRSDEKKKKKEALDSLIQISPFSFFTLLGRGGGII